MLSIFAPTVQCWTSVVVSSCTQRSNLLTKHIKIVTGQRWLSGLSKHWVYEFELHMQHFFFTARLTRKKSDNANVWMIFSKTLFFGRNATISEVVYSDILLILDNNLMKTWVFFQGKLLVVPLRDVKRCHYRVQGEEALWRKTRGTIIG